MTFPVSGHINGSICLICIANIIIWGQLLVDQPQQHCGNFDWWTNETLIQVICPVAKNLRFVIINSWGTKTISLTPMSLWHYSFSSTAKSGWLFNNIPERLRDHRIYLACLKVGNPPFLKMFWILQVLLKMRVRSYKYTKTSYLKPWPHKQMVWATDI